MTHSAIHQHPELEGTISHRNVYWSLKPVTLTGNITIASGGELIIESGDTITMNGYSIKSTGGTLTVQGLGATWIPDIRLSSKPNNRYGTIQAAINDADTTSVSTVSIKSTGTFSENLFLRKNVIVKNESGGTVTVGNGGVAIAALDSADNSKVIGINLDGSTWVAYIEDATGVTFQNCTINDSAFIGVAMVDAAATFDTMQVSNAVGDGFLLTNSDPRIKTTKIWNNGDEAGDMGVYCQNGSEPNLDGQGNANDFSGNYDHDISAASDCGDIDATDNLWNETPDVNHAGSPTYSINVSGWTLYKPVAVADSIQVLAKNLIAQGRVLVDEGQWESGLSLFKQVVDGYADTDAAKTALDATASVYWEQGRFEDAVVYLDQVSRSHAHSDLGVKAEYFSLRHRVRLGDYEGVLGRADAIFTSYPQATEAPFAMLRKGRIYLHQLNNSQRAAEIFEDVLTLYPEHKGVQKLAKGYLSMIHGESGLPIQEKLENNQQENAKLANYPNPFNPATTIAFAVAKSEPVDLIIYNALGQKVRTLMAGTTLTVGTHRIVWDGKDERGLFVSSGVYLYELRAGDQTQVRKMLMIK